MSLVILLTDDDEGFRSSIKLLLELEGFEVLETDNGRQALRILNETYVDVCITDILMPDMDGIELSEQLKEVRPDLKIIGMTGGGQLSHDKVKRDAKRLFDVFLIKPFNKKELLSEITLLSPSQD